MQLTVNGNDVFVATGGKPFDPSLPAVVMIHGAGFDHSTWAAGNRGIPADAREPLLGLYASPLCPRPTV